jgi:hypothetical protein
MKSKRGRTYDVLEWFGGHDPDKGNVLIGGFESYGFHDIYEAINATATSLPN